MRGERGNRIGPLSRRERVRVRAGCQGEDRNAMKSSDPQPTIAPSRRRWLLAAAIALTAAWIALLVVLAVLR